jgi:hypothetical protein
VVSHFCDWAIFEAFQGVLKNYAHPVSECSTISLVMQVPVSAQPFLQSNKNDGHISGTILAL